MYLCIFIFFLFLCLLFFDLLCFVLFCFVFLFVCFTVPEGILDLATPWATFVAAIAECPAFAVPNQSEVG